MSEQIQHAKIVAKMKSMIRDLEQVIIDKEYWNATRLDATPFDVGMDKVLLRLSRLELAAFQRGDVDETIRLVAEQRRLLSIE